LNQPATATVEAMERHGPQVLKAIWHLVPSADDARDLYQETFLQHHLALSRGRRIDHPCAWLCQTARHAAFRLRRQRLKQGQRLGDEVLDNHAARSVDPDHRLLLDRIRDLAAGLPERQGQVFVMRHFEQMSFAEIATQLDISEDAARASGHKALGRLRALMNRRPKDVAEEAEHVV